MKKVLILIILLSNITYGQKAEKLDSLFTALYQNRQFNGNVLIAEKGEVIFKKSYGLSNEAEQDTLNSNSMFELASVSKQFTAMGIVQLAKDKKLKYDDLIANYIPELNFYGEITIENLLHHISGVPDYMSLFEKHWDKTKFATNQDIVNLLVKYKPDLEFEPGEKYEYSNTGYTLLALIIERVSGKTFGDYLNDKIFKPLGMNRTTVYRSKYMPRDIDNYAKAYFSLETEENKVPVNCIGKNSMYYYLDGIVGDGMVNSTTEDLLKWDRALYNDEIINDKDRKLIFTPGKLNNNERTKYGLGWSITEQSDFGKIAYHSGGWAGYITFIERDLDNDKTIILLQNNELKNSTIPIRQIRNILYEIPEKLPTKEDLMEFAGIYIMDDEDSFTLTYENEKLFVSDLIPGDKLQLIPISENKFKVKEFIPTIFVTLKVLKNKIEIAVLEQPVYSVKMVGVKTEKMENNR